MDARGRHVTQGKSPGWVRRWSSLIGEHLLPALQALGLHHGRPSPKKLRAVPGSLSSRYTGRASLPTRCSTNCTLRIPLDPSFGSFSFPPCSHCLPSPHLGRGGWPSGISVLHTSICPLWGCHLSHLQHLSCFWGLVVSEGGLGWAQTGTKISDEASGDTGAAPWGNKGREKGCIQHFMLKET